MRLDLKPSSRVVIRQAARQQCWRDACLIAKRFENYKPKISEHRDFTRSYDQTFVYWVNKALVNTAKQTFNTPHDPSLLNLICPVWILLGKVSLEQYLKQIKTRSYLYESEVSIDEYACHTTVRGIRYRLLDQKRNHLSKNRLAFGQRPGLNILCSEKNHRYFADGMLQMSFLEINPLSESIMI